MRTLFLVLAFVTFAVNSKVFADTNSRGGSSMLGTVAWFDITTTNIEKSRRFYEVVFGWTFRPVTGTDQALSIAAASGEIGTLRFVPGPIGNMGGSVYIEVADIRVSYKTAREAGATVEAEDLFPMNLPDGKGAIAFLFDPEGHPFGMFSRAPIP